MAKYAIGVDFGTLSCRALLVDVKTGEELATSVLDYPHSVMDEELPSGKKLGADWALQDPQDYLDVLKTTIPDVIKQSGVNAEDIIGLGLDFTACTVMPVKKDGTPLCFIDKFKDELFVYGIEPHTDSLDSYLAAESGSLKFSPTSKGNGTGTKIELYDEDGNLVKTYTLVIFGDVNGDGWYDATDATLVNCIVGGMFTKEQLGEAAWLAADCNHDGVINEADSELLQQAGIMLQSINQNAQQSELETSSAYTEYISIIEQTVETEKPDDAPTENPDKTPTEEPTEQNWVVVFFEQLFNLIKLLLSILK